MLVKELIELLQKMPQDLEVYSYCDHGQSPEKSSSPQIAFTNNLTHCLWEDWTTDEEDAEENECTRKFVLL